MPQGCRNWAIESEVGWWDTKAHEDRAMSTPPAYWAPPLPNRQRAPNNTDDGVLAHNGGRLPRAPVLDFPLPRAPNHVTDRGYDLDQPANRPASADDRDLDKVRAVTCELQNAAGRLPRASQLPMVPGLSPIGVPAPRAKVEKAVPRPITVKRVPVERPAPPVTQRRERLSRPAKFLVAAAVGVPLAGYVVIAGPYPIVGEAPAPELRSVDRLSMKVQPLLQAGFSSTAVDQSAARDKPDTGLESHGPKPLSEPTGRADATGDRTVQQLPDHQGGGDDVATVDGRDRLLIADSGLRYLTRTELEKLSRFAWYWSSASIVPFNPVEDANTGAIGPVDTPVAAPDAASPPSPLQKEMRKGFTLTDSSRQYLTREQLQGLSPDQLVIARNEIFARKGRYFKEDALRDYFSQFSWYQPHAWDVTLSPVELANVELIQSVEQYLGGSRHVSSQVRIR
jgi:hypothetical protein